MRRCQLKRVLSMVSMKCCDLILAWLFLYDSNSNISLSLFLSNRINRRCERLDPQSKLQGGIREKLPLILPIMC